MTVQPSLFDDATPQNALMAYVEQEAERMWQEPEHRKRSVAQVRRFAEYGDNHKRPLSQFNADDIDNFAEVLLDGGSSKATVNRYLASISKVFNHAVHKRKLKFAPKATFYKIKSERIRYFSETEITEMLRFFKDRKDWWMHDMVQLALLTGMRKGEIIALGEGRATISPCKQWIELPPEVTKTNKGRNVAIANSDASEAAQRLVIGLASEYTKKRFEYRWELLKREIARNDDTFVFHVTRHNAASRMANDLSVPTVVIAKILGHSSTDTTARYVHEKPDTLLEISARM